MPYAGAVTYWLALSLSPLGPSRKTPGNSHGRQLLSTRSSGTEDRLRCTSSAEADMSIHDI